ncbi:hypothetical protein JR316_0001510 [Psilocybe cubensis]|uniref:Uncharacterized protein n=2 Tax=Psilocybe cubensis TaxID=181762 RepID=A0ACB8HHV8_PSICU|nr:hypothetical protein JR316_0001510 [Psilocybe cubensis]KAH9487434.1 hypothetical protein JR316_0001510 [Psilocybe cubensis]
MLESNPLLARRVAVASLIVDTLFQSLALLGDAESSRSSPSAIYVAYAPHPYAPIGLFSAGLILQIQWLLRLSLPSKEFDEEEETSAIPLEITPTNSESSIDNASGELSERTDSQPANDAHKTEEIDDDLLLRDEVDDVTYFNTHEPAYLGYLPFYVMGCFLQAGWAVLWMTRHYDYCAMFLLLNLAIEAYALFWILGGSKNHRYPQSNIFTHLIVKIKIATSVLYLWKTWGAVDILPPPSASEGIVTCTFFVCLALASGPDPTLGFLLAIVLLGLATGQNHYFEWSLLFGWTCMSVSIVVALDWAFGVKSRRILMPQLARFEEGTERLLVNRQNGL